MTKIISKTIFATMKICCWNREQRMTMNSDSFLFDRENDSCNLQLKNGKRRVEIKELKKNKRNLEYLITSDRPNVRFWFGSSAALGGSARFGRTTEPADFTEPEPN